MQSRNQREGYLDGYVRGKFARIRTCLGKPLILYSRNSIPLNRTQRKEHKRGGYWSPSFKE